MVYTAEEYVSNLCSCCRYTIDSLRYEQYPRLLFLDRHQLPKLLRKLAALTKAEPFAIFYALVPFFWACFPEYVGAANVLTQQRICEAHAKAYQNSDVKNMIVEGEETAETAIFLQVAAEMIAAFAQSLDNEGTS